MAGRDTFVDRLGACRADDVEKEITCSLASPAHPPNLRRYNENVHGRFATSNRPVAAAAATTTRKIWSPREDTRGEKHATAAAAAAAAVGALVMRWCMFSRQPVDF